MTEKQSLAQEIASYVRAGYTGLWVRSTEHEEAIMELCQMCVGDGKSGGNGWAWAVWDFDSGLKGCHQIASQRTAGEAEREPAWFSKNPIQMIRSMGSIAAKTGGDKTLIILKNFHRRDITENSLMLQAMLNSMWAGKSAEHSWCFVVLAPTAKLPIEWESDFVLIDHALPDKEQLWKLAQQLPVEQNELPSTDEQKAAVLEAASGMTRRGAEGAFSLSVVRNKPFDPGIIWDIKAQVIRACGYLRLYEGSANFADMGGIQNYKDFSLRLLGKTQTDPLLFPKGQLLLGVPGSGKSQAVKCLGNETGRRVLMLDMGALRSKYQGETDSNIRKALEIADAMAPCILFVDEVEKAMSGVASSGETDGGASARVFATMLTWLNDHQTDVFFIGTCNDMSKLPAEFSRADRFDGIFFFDLPSKEERAAIWDIYLKLYKRKISAAERDRLIAESNDWTGAEIKTACKLSAILDVPIADAMINVVPIVETARDKLEELRKWASNRCLSATTPGRFSQSSRNRKPEDLLNPSRKRRVSKVADN